MMKATKREGRFDIVWLLDKAIALLLAAYILTPLHKMEIKTLLETSKKPGLSAAPVRPAPRQNATFGAAFPGVQP